MADKDENLTNAADDDVKDDAKTTEDATVEDEVAEDESADDEVAEDESDSDSEDDDEDADSEEDKEDKEFQRKLKEFMSEDNQKNMTPQMRRLMAREKEQSRRVEKSIEGTKTNPSWFLPLACFLLLLGLIWVVVFYLTMGDWPIHQVGNWNVAIGFGIALVGFLMLMWWH